MTITALIFLYAEKKRDVVKALEMCAMHSCTLCLSEDGFQSGNSKCDEG